MLFADAASLAVRTQLDRITKQEFAKLEKKLGEDEGKGDDTAKESSVA